MKKKTVRTILFNVLIAALAIFWIVPIVWLVCTSFSAYDGMNVSTFFPETWSAVHYAKILQSDSVNQFVTWFWNTFKIACFTCVISTFFVLMVAYATSVMRFKMRKPLMNIAVILNLFPGMLAMIAVYFTLKTFNLTNSHIGLIMVYSASSGLGYLIAKGFFDTVPRALCEAARLDGCNEARIFLTVVVPMSKPIIATIGLMTLIAYWNNWTNGIYFITTRTDLYGIQNYLNDVMNKASFLTSHVSGMINAADIPNISVRMAIAVVAVIPLLLAYPFFQQYFVKGITLGSVKG